MLDGELAEVGAILWCGGGECGVVIISIALVAPQGSISCPVKKWTKETGRGDSCSRTRGVPPAPPKPVDCFCRYAFFVPKGYGYLNNVFDQRVAVSVGGAGGQ